MISWRILTEFAMYILCYVYIVVNSSVDKQYLHFTHDLNEHPFKITNRTMIRIYVSCYSICLWLLKIVSVSCNYNPHSARHDAIMVVYKFYDVMVNALDENSSCKFYIACAVIKQHFTDLSRKIKVRLPKCWFKIMNEKRQRMKLFLDNFNMSWWR